MLRVWNNILRHVAADNSDMKSVSGIRDFMSNVRKIATKFIRLTRVLQAVKSLLKLVSYCFSLFCFFSFMKAVSLVETKAFEVSLSWESVI